MGGTDAVGLTQRVMVSRHRVGLGVLKSMQGPILTSNSLCKRMLHGSGVPRNGPPCGPVAMEFCLSILFLLYFDGVQALDRWQERLEATFDGKPYDILDAALTETVSRFPVAIQPFYDMIEGMRMDLVKPRYQTFDELYEYCYRVAGTVGLMSTPVMGIDPSYKVSAWC